MCDPTAAQASIDSTRQAIWAVRESIPVSLARLCRHESPQGPFLFKYDISIPVLQDMLPVAEEVAAALRAEGFAVATGLDDVPEKREGEGKGGSASQGDGGGGAEECLLRVFYYGHAGDQNLHLNVILRCLLS